MKRAGRTGVSGPALLTTRYCAERELAAAAGNIRKAIGDQEIDVIVELVTELEDAEWRITVYGTLLLWTWALIALYILYYR